MNGTPGDMFIKQKRLLEKNKASAKLLRTTQQFVVKSVKLLEGAVNLKKIFLIYRYTITQGICNPSTTSYAMPKSSLK